MFILVAFFFLGIVFPLFDLVKLVRARCRLMKPIKQYRRALEKTR